MLYPEQSITDQKNLFLATKDGAPERIRTSGLLNRNQMLYPAELRVRLIVVVCIGGDINNDRLQLA